MKKMLTFLLLIAASASAGVANKFPKLPNGWHVHDMDRPLPKVVTPGQTDSDAPSDAIVLFDGSNFNAWWGGKDGTVPWILGEGFMEVVPKTGSVLSRQKFGDVQLHVEWAAPAEVVEEAQRRGNSGVFMMGKYEIQIMDAWENTAYPDGMAGAVYGQTPALVNVCKQPGEWQSFDIFFTAPVFKGGELVTPAYVTILQNGVLVQNHMEIYGPTEHNKAPPYKVHADKLPIVLQNHGQSVRFRNIWVREL
ncbi:3-keto-disaccharide hydrolase [Pontiella sulfatireligans]|uniref:3-keto-alpha-glucoside-1,2-lyase/3-keto-2-hydroxy-glucal hydratase domain-containing protein n=1 Tax=Pontiella sulfatireligans TaxID=2750658 RepID=A0A6C2UQE8_9BACT|nr:DUF1080 domain-containing protein [Pontiella sulfatireligans]VGO22438.1 hypothetical protein SCARR_04521 [Pontiella sulfatireligans]